MAIACRKGFLSLWRNARCIIPAKTLMIDGRCVTERSQVSGRRYSSRSLTVENMNVCVRDMEYAVRGTVPLEAMKIKGELEKGSGKYPFSRILSANIGDSHAMGQQPLTFTRQLVAACVDPSLIEKGAYPSDVLTRARTILNDVGGGSLGSYTDSRGITIIRKQVEEFISKRDGIKANMDDIYLINGATDGIRSTIMLCLTEGQKAGVMIPIPQYPLYTATLTELNAHPIKYYLDEDDAWSIKVEELQRALDESKSHCQPRLMAVINPGNPTGQYLPEENIREIIQFCHQNNLLLLADEVYQENVWAEKVKFSSFRKTLLGMGSEYKDVQLVSFNSTSKGYFGECGIRGGYMEMIGFSPELMEHIYKLHSTRLCANAVGQVVTGVMVRPPQPGDPSYDLFEEERQQILSSLKLRAQMVHTKFNKIPGVFCNEVQGAMYAFPRIDIPEEALEDAKKEDPNMTLDTYYCLEFLRQQGVCVVPGSGFGQKSGTWHFRTTVLPSVSDLVDLLDRFETFHVNFLKKYNRL